MRPRKIRSVCFCGLRVIVTVAEDGTRTVTNKDGTAHTCALSAGRHHERRSLA